jgi:hypothetical protein
MKSHGELTDSVNEEGTILNHIRKEDEKEMVFSV